MALRRLAQQNINRKSGSDSPHDSPRTPRTPRPSNIYRSPLSSPSLSASIPFDWEAARSNRPAPFSPLNPRTPRSSNPATPGRKARIRRQSTWENITSIPSNIAFQWSMFPHNLPLPHHKTTAWILGGSMHFLHFCVRVHQINQVPDSDMGWEDMYHEGGHLSWFDWTVPISFLLLLGSVLNALYLFTRVKLYRLHHQRDPVASPNARFVESDLDFSPLEAPPMLQQVASFLWRAFNVSWRFLLGVSSPGARAANSSTVSRVQQLEVWTPGELELTLFCVYSPAHFLLWMATGSSNWIIMLLVMGLVGGQLDVLCKTYAALVKDKEIIAAQVLNEYNQVFVNPRVYPLKSDAAVMTHQSEMVNVWED